MNVKRRLMELIDFMPHHEGKTFEDALADHLVANKVTVLPCNVGDTVYIIVGGLRICEHIVDSVCITEYFVQVDTSGSLWGNHRTVYGDSFGKTVFLTKEEAEKALARTERNNG